MKAYTKTKINENKKIESSETAETPPPLPLNNLRWFARNKRKYHAELIRSESGIKQRNTSRWSLLYFCFYLLVFGQTEPSLQSETKVQFAFLFSINKRYIPPVYQSLWVVHILCLALEEHK